MTPRIWLKTVGGWIVLMENEITEEQVLRNHEALNTKHMNVEVLVGYLELM